MRKTKRLVIGIVMLVAGAAGLFILAFYQANVVFNNISFHGPDRPFPGMHCPKYAQVNEVVEVGITLKNPSSVVRQYHMGLNSSELKVAPAKGFPIYLPGGEEVDLRWAVSASVEGRKWVTISAVTEEDAALPGPYHFWPTSYRSDCNFLVVPGPIPGVILPWLGWAGVIAGLVLILSVFILPISRRL